MAYVICCHHRKGGNEKDKKRTLCTVDNCSCAHQECSDDINPEHDLAKLTRCVVRVPRMVLPLGAVLPITRDLVVASRTRRVGAPLAATVLAPADLLMKDTASRCV